MKFIRLANLFKSLSQSKLEFDGRFGSLYVYNVGMDDISNFLSGEGSRALEQMIRECAMGDRNNYDILYGVNVFLMRIWDKVAIEVSFGNKDIDPFTPLLIQETIRFSNLFNRLMRDYDLTTTTFYKDEDGLYKSEEMPSQVKLLIFDRNTGANSIGNLIQFIGYDTLYDLISRDGFDPSPSLMTVLLRNKDLIDDRVTEGRERLRNLLMEKFPLLSDAIVLGNEWKLSEITSRMNEGAVDDPERMFSFEGGFSGAGMFDPRNDRDLINMVLGIEDDPSLYGELMLANVEREKPLFTYPPASPSGIDGKSNAIIRMVEAGMIRPDANQDSKKSKTSLILSLMSSNLSKEALQAIEWSLGGDFTWPTLASSDTSEGLRGGLFLNGLLTPEAMLEYASEFPQEVDNINTPIEIPNFQEIYKAASEAMRKINMEEGPFIEYAIRYGAVRVSFMSQDSELMSHLLNEARSMGVPEEEMERYASFVKIYSLNEHNYVSLCHEHNKNPNSFLGFDLSDIGGAFSGNAIDHEGNRSPIIIIKRGDPASKAIEKFFENMKASGMVETSRMTKAHEGAHAVSYLAIGNNSDIRQEDQPVGGETFSYMTSIPEAIAFGHGTIPALADIVRERILRIASSPVFQESIEKWAISRVMSSDDARLHGFMKPEEMNKEFNRLRKEFGEKADEFIRKRIERQQSQIIRMMKQMQQEGKIERINEIQKENKALTERLSTLREIDDEYSQIQKKIMWNEKRIEIIRSGGYDVDIEDVVDAIVRGFMFEYFRSISYPSSHYSTGQSPSVSDVQDYTDFLTDATLGVAPGQPRPLTSEYIPVFSTPADREGFYPHLSEKQAMISRRLLRLSSIMDEKMLHHIGDRIDSLMLR